MNSAKLLILNACRYKNSQAMLSEVTSAYECTTKALDDGLDVLRTIQSRKPDWLVTVVDERSIYKAVGIAELSAVEFPGLRTLLVLYSETQNPEDSRPLFHKFDDTIINPGSGALLREHIDGFMQGPDVAEKELAKQKLFKNMTLRGTVGRDPNFLKSISNLPIIANSDIAVLILGETGVGKEVCARAIHYLSKRSDRPFIAVNCSAIPANLFENEFFGHKRGAFTDAREHHKGMIEEAQGGTVFLDEVDTLSFEAQSKILRLVQEKTYRSLGDHQEKQADIRIIAASNADLKMKISEGAFRSDLYYRFGVALKLPPLRERKADIPLLAEHFLHKHRLDGETPPKNFSSEALRKLLCYHWPGNIRELENIVRQAILFSRGTLIEPQDLNIVSSDAAHPAEKMSFQEAKKMAVEKFEKEYLTQLLIISEGNITLASKKAGKDRADLSRLIKKYRLNSDINRG